MLGGGGKLRTSVVEGSFYPYEALLYTMLHELVHMEIGPHNAKFYKMLDELRDECEKLIREGKRKKAWGRM